MGPCLYFRVPIFSVFVAKNINPVCMYTTMSNLSVLSKNYFDSNFEGVGPKTKKSKHLKGRFEGACR